MADDEVRAALDETSVCNKLRDLFDIGYHTKHVDHDILTRI